MTEKTTRVSIVEDDDHIRNMFIVLLEGAHGFRCVSGYPDAESALNDIPAKKPDLVLMDINLPGMNGIECLIHLKKLVPDTQVVMLTVYEDAERIFESLTAGAVGYLLKSTSPAEVLVALAEVRNGGAPMSAQIARKVVQSFSQTEKSADSSLSELTARESEILSHLSSGLMYKEIAAELFVSYETVKSHIRKIYSKLHVNTRTEAVLKFIEHKRQV